MQRDFEAGGPPPAARSSRPKVLLAALGIFLTGLVLWLLLSPNREEAPVRPLTVEGSASASITAELTRLQRFENTEGGYKFSYPRRWKARGEGSTTRLHPRDKRVLMSFGFAPEGGLRSSSRELLATVVASYDDPAVREEAQLETIHGRRALIVAGEGTNDAGVRLNFLVVTIDGRNDNYGITVFTEAGSDPRKVLPPVQRIIASFKATSAGF